MSVSFQREAVLFSDLIADCSQCEKETSTRVQFMRQGIGNACAECGCLRKGKPYLSKSEFNALKPAMAKGGSCDKKSIRL